MWNNRVRSLSSKLSLRPKADSEGIVQWKCRLGRMIREYWMIYRGLGFLTVVWVSSSPTPLPLLPSLSPTGDIQRDNLLTEDGGRERKEANQSLQKRATIITIWPCVLELEVWGGRCGYLKMWESWGLIENLLVWAWRNVHRNETHLISRVRSYEGF